MEKSVVIIPTYDDPALPRLPEAVRHLDDAGEFRWRIENARPGSGRFLAALFQTDAMEGLAGRSVTGDFAERRRAASERVVAVFEDMLKWAGKREHALLIMLDQVEDPHNLGAIVRSALCAGVAAVLIGPEEEQVGLARGLRSRGLRGRRHSRSRRRRSRGRGRHPGRTDGDGLEEGPAVHGWPRRDV